ncbi:Aste57867_19448 [Aphanomyces stellatus]|uniref:Aste57867_19448 protein n=1 Tax=Aphanomyces stellatus TaxID=120398 RepID=A0A485LCR9_9STRA|nr:hypothetical protein As57867_019384 [Aphanomyces stellatus]VFT96161.1 Aste57867_19448 [Aphanomyces stellatus]
MIVPAPVVLDSIVVSPLADDNLVELRSPLPMSAQSKRHSLYHEQMQERTGTDDPAWRATVDDIAQLSRLKRLYQRQRTTENLLMLLALLSIVAEGAAVELYWEAETLQWSIVPLEMMKTLVTCMTAVMIWTLFWRFELEAQIEACTHRLHPKDRFSHVTVNLLWAFLFECAILVVHLPPGIDYRFQVLECVATADMTATPACGPGLVYDQLKCYDDTVYSINQFGIVVVIRWYLSVGFVRNLCGLNTNEIKLIGTLNHVDTSSSWFTRKYTFRLYPATFTVLILLLVWAFTTLAVHQLDRSTDNTTVDNYFDSAYFVIVTMTSVGFGDAIVKGIPAGSFCVVGGIFFGAAICALCRVVAIAALSITPNEGHVIRTIKEQNLQTESRHVAVSLIQLQWMRFRLMHLPGGSSSPAVHAICLKSHRLISRARQLRRERRRRRRPLEEMTQRWLAQVDTRCSVIASSPVVTDDYDALVAKLTHALHRMPS